MDPTQKLLAAIATLGEACAMKDGRIAELEELAAAQREVIESLSVPPQVAASQNGKPAEVPA